MSGNKQLLYVYLGNKTVATISFIDNEIIWQYTQQWQKNGFAVSPHLPLSDEIDNIDAEQFLRNLLPEGKILEDTAKNISTTTNDTFTLLAALGLDLPGALMISPLTIDELPKESIYFIHENMLSDRLDLLNKGYSLAIWNNKPRVSLAGYQNKLNVIINSKGQIGFTEGKLGSTHILKFEKNTQKNLVLNEYITMRLANRCKLNVASVALRKIGNHTALLVERFDRKLINKSNVKRRYIIDGYQALSLSPDFQYESSTDNNRDTPYICDGISLPMLVDFTNQCQTPILIKQQLLDWLLFNLLVYNYDAHSKNISFFIGKHGISLAPFYDLVNTQILSGELELSDKLNTSHSNAARLITEFANSCQLTRRHVIRRIKFLVKNITRNLPNEIKSINDQYQTNAYFKDYQKMIKHRCQYFITRC
ncbi:HipA domain-containing protein [Thiotrichales bacterium 19S11-10]|nr:HipA domain-containing protein [Thiotrichales bacterium 19S11-10]